MKFSLSICILFTSIIMVVFISCTENNATRIIKKSIKAHGGMEAWENIETFSLQKETQLYFENGEVESLTVQDLEFRQKPFFEGKITWEKDSINHKIVFDGSKTRYWMAENEILNEGFLVNKKKDLDAAYYVLNKPFDLLGQGKSLEYQGITKFADGREAETVQVIDGDAQDPNVDTWWYFFDKNSFQIIAYKVKSSDHFSMVYNYGWDDSTGILFPKNRESYRVDSAGNQLFLRAKYEFQKYVVK